MDIEIITIYVICYELLKAMGIREAPQSKMNNAEVMTVVLTATRYFGGNFRTARLFLSEHRYILNMLSESRLNRRIQAIDFSVWQNLFAILAETFKESNTTKEYIIDSFPVPICDNIRISRSEIVKDEEYRGFIASKHRYFFGIRVHMITSGDGEPIEFIIAPGSNPDVTILKNFDFNLPPGSIIYADKGYTDYKFEDILKEDAGITLSPMRKKNSVRATDSYLERLGRRYKRKRIETTFSQITNLFPKKIHAVTFKCFCMKVAAFIISFSIHLL